MPAADDENFLFDVFRLDIRGRRLLCRDEDVQLQPKVFEVLRHLVRHHGEALSINEILDACWGNVSAGPNSVTNAIYSLRSVLEAGGGTADWIQTVPRRGYRFAAPAIEVSALSLSPGVAEVAADADFFVGREPELAWFEQRWDQVVRGVPTTVFLNGEAGIGKTTLVRRLCARAEPVPQLCIGRCTPQHREAEPYMPVIEALSSFAGDSGIVEMAREQAPTWLAQMPWLVPQAERSSLGEVIEGANSARMLREGKRLFAALANLSPLILVLEDVHWADAATVDLIRALADSEHASHLMLIATYRPHEIVVTGHPLRNVVGALAAHPRCGILALGSLTQAHVRQYLERRFSSTPLAAELAPRLEERSGGNPLFLDAMTTYLCEQQRIVLQDQHWVLATALAGLVVDLPEGLRDMIRALLRGLTPDDVQTLQAAAAAGMDFTSLDVAAALDLSLTQVEQRCETLAGEGHFIHAVGEVSWPDGSSGMSYRFAHAAYRDALVSDTPRHRRRDLHRRIGERLQRAFGAQVREISPRLATHFGLAGDPERQIQHLENAVLLSAGRYAHQETLAFLDRILEVLQQLPDDEARAGREVGYQVERSRVLMDWQGYAAAVDSFVRVVELAQRQGNRFLEFFGRVGCCISQLMGAGQGSGPSQSEALLEIAADGHPELVALAHTMAGLDREGSGDLAGAVSHAEAALVALPDALLGIPRGFALETLIRISLQSSLGKLGHFDRYRHERELATEGAEQRSGLRGRAHSFAFLACDALIAAEPQIALQLAERAIQNAREGDFDRYLTAGEAIREAARLALIADAEIESINLERLAAAVEQRRRWNESWHNMMLAGAVADGYRRRGEIGKARAYIATTYATAGVVYSAELLRIEGEIEVAAARHGTAAERKRASREATRCFRSALAIAQQHGTRLFELRAAASLARHQRGAEGSREGLATILQSFAGEGMTSDVRAAAEVHADLTKLSGARPAPDWK